MMRKNLFHSHVRPLTFALLACSLLGGTALAQSTDPITTSTVNRTGSISSAQASQGFVQALGLLKTDKQAAYDRARGLADDVERRTVQWAAIYAGEGEVDHKSVVRFMADAPAYATQRVYKNRMERALTKTDAGHTEIISLLGGAMPATLDGQLALAAAYVKDGQVERAGRIVKSVWRNKFLDKKSEAKVLQNFSRLLTRDDHWARAVHLLMHDRASGAERLMDRLSPAQKTLARARVAVSRKAKNVTTLIDRVDPAYRDHPLFHFARGQYARDKGALKTAVKHLDKVKTNVPDAAEFWYERRLIARRALAAGHFDTAYAAAAGYGDGPEGRVVDANFHAGWIALTYLKKPDTARRHFEKMRSLSTLSSTVTQSNYWLGRSLKALGKSAEARAAFEKAGAYNHLYYGQLARLEMGITKVGLKGLPAWRHSQEDFAQHPLTRSVKLLAAHGEKGLAETLLRRHSANLSDSGALILAARLAQAIGAHNVAVLIADRSRNRGTNMDAFQYPKDGLPKGAKLASIDKAAIYAIARQESHFDADAVSRSGARGLMQLMPGTAKEVAKQVGVKYSSKRLADPAYNALLGSTYLATQLKRYDGSLVLAAAAYNAGGGNVNKWLKVFGDPRKSNIDAVAWIETIPFTETRKYVQRVMGNYMVYRARLGTETQTLAEALRRIPQ